MSARPGPSGGYHASDIPTGIFRSRKRAPTRDYKRNGDIFQKLTLYNAGQGVWFR